MTEREIIERCRQSYYDRMVGLDRDYEEPEEDYDEEDEVDEDEEEGVAE